MKRLLLVSVAVLGVGVAATPIAASFVIRQQLALRDDASLDEAEFQRFLDDQRTLTTAGPLPTRRGTKDAGVVLNPFLTLDAGTDAERTPDVAAWWAEPAIGDALRCPGAPRQGGPRYLDCLDTLPTGDLAFLDRLHAYDTWDQGSSGAWARYLAAHPDTPPDEGALPNYVSLQWLARLRLADGLRRADPLPALADVRQLAVLTWTSESLVGEAVALAILRIEREGYEAAVDRGLLPAEMWTPISEEERLRYQRAAWGTVGILQGLGPPDAARRLIDAVPEPIGFCAAVDEAMTTAPLVRALFTRPWPGEVDLAAQLAPIDAAMAGDRCQLRRARTIWAHPERDLALVEAGGEAWEVATVHTPWMRQIVGGILLGVATADFNRYDDDEAPRSPGAGS